MASHRWHKSTKVPGVKLRPRRPPGASSAIAGTDNHQEASDYDDDDHDAAGDYEGHAEQDAAELPLYGYTLCLTGISEQKSALWRAAASLGATIEGNLTESTTHLLALTPGSTKYQCALRLGLYILRPEFVFELHRRWQHAEDNLDVDGLLATHALGALGGLRIGTCGIVEPATKRKVRSDIQHMGAQTVLPMVFDGSVSHLICGVTHRKQSNTLQHVYDLRRGNLGTAEERRGATVMKCVRPEWLQDCKRLGGLIPEEPYDIWTNQQPLTRADREAILAEFPDRSAAAMKRRLQEQMRTLQDVKQREEAERNKDREANESRRAKGLTKMPPPLRPASRDEMGRSQLEAGGPKRLLSMPRQVNEAPVQQATSNTTATVSNKDAEPAVLNEVTSTSKSNAVTAAPAEEMDPPSTFAKCAIRIDLAKKDSAKLPMLRSALVGAGARLVARDDSSQSADFCVTSHDGHARGQEARPANYGRLVNLHWVDQCLFHERVVPVDENTPPYLLPSGVALPSEIGKGCSVALTGFPSDDSTPDRHQLTSALQMLGCQMTSTFARRVNTHLLSAHCMALEGGEASMEAMSVSVLEQKGWMKESKAKSWGIPIVGMAWFRRAWIEGHIHAPSPRSLSAAASRVSSATGDESLQTLDETQATAGSSSARAAKGSNAHLEEKGEGNAISPPGRVPSNELRPGAVAKESALTESTSAASNAQAHAGDDAGQRQRSSSGQQSSLSRIDRDLAALISNSRSRRGYATTPTSDAASHGGGGGSTGAGVGGGASEPRSGSEMGGGTPAPYAKRPPRLRRSASGSGSNGGAGHREDSPAARLNSRAGSALRDSLSPAKLTRMADADGGGQHSDAIASANDGEDAHAIEGGETLDEAARMLAMNRAVEAERAQRARLSHGHGSEEASLGPASAPLATQGEAGGWGSGRHHHLADMVTADVDSGSSSIRITYRDPQSEQERKRLEALVSRAQAAASASAAAATATDKSSTTATTAGATADEPESETMAETPIGENHQAGRAGKRGHGQVDTEGDEAVKEAESRAKAPPAAPAAAAATTSAKGTSPRKGTSTTTTAGGPGKKRIQARKQPGTAAG